MPESLIRTFFRLIYEQLGTLILGSLLRALPWLPLLAWLTFMPPGEDLGATAWIPAGLGLAAFFLAPYLAGGIYLQCAGLARDAALGWRRGMGRRYLPLATWNLIQALLAAAILGNLVHVVNLAPEARGFPEFLALGAGAWLWILARLFSFRFVPFLMILGRPTRDTLRLTLLSIASHPGPTLAHFLQRQVVGLALALSGVGLLVGAASFLPLHACLSARLVLERDGLDPAPPG